jgi:hypothetical protein
MTLVIALSNELNRVIKYDDGADRRRLAGSLLTFSERKLQPAFAVSPNVPRSGIIQTEDLKRGLKSSTLKHILTLLPMRWSKSKRR